VVDASVSATSCPPTPWWKNNLMHSQNFIASNVRTFNAALAFFLAFLSSAFVNRIGKYQTSWLLVYASYYILPEQDTRY